MGRTETEAFGGYCRKKNNNNKNIISSRLGNQKKHI